jgi:hypothetical protein
MTGFANGSDNGTSMKFTTSAMQRLAGRARLHRVRWAVLCAALTGAGIAGACANVTEPPGGPPDVNPPVVIKLSPDSGSIIPKPKSVVVQFDEVISETPKGQQNLAALVFISPRSGAAEVDWNRTSISIRPSRGWKPNTVYSVTINPGILDLRSNSIDTAIRTVFSTGGEIPKTRISGAAFDWTIGKPAPHALIEALVVDSTKKDTTFYQTLADSSGRYELRYLPPGPYLVRAVLDRNSNRGLEPLEPWDTLRLTVTAEATADLYTFVHDTVGIRISDLAVTDSGRTLKITFDKPIAPNQYWTPDRIKVQKADSSSIAVVRVVSPAQRATEDSARAKAVADSVARANIDTTAAGRARADTIARRRIADSVANAERAAREARRLAILRGERAGPRDTTPPPKFQRPLVYTELFVTLAEPLPANARLRVTVSGAVGLSGVVRAPTRELTTPKAPAKPDTTAAKRAPVPPVRRDTMDMPARRE